MKGGSKLFIFAGIGLALVAVVLGITSLSGGGGTEAKKDTNSEKVKVVQAKADIPAFTIITADLLTTVDVPSEQANADSVTSTAEVVGLTYSVPLRAGQPLVRALVETPGLRNDIAVGKRAIAIPVDEISAMSGLVQSNDYIDIIFHARINVIRVLPSVAEVLEEQIYEINSPPIYPPDLEVENYPFTGDPGSKFVIRDDVNDLSELEPVAKIMLQDIRVLRVIRPGDEFLGDGSISQDSGDAASSAIQQSAPKGQLILEVTPEQAELVTFMQDQKHKYQVVVRGKDDHTVVNTQGITFEILTSDPNWLLPYPQSVSTPKEQPTGDEENADGEDGGEQTSDEETPDVPLEEVNLDGGDGGGDS